MRRKIILSIAVILSITLLLLTSSDSTVKAQNQIRVVADTGIVTLGPNQKLRVSVMEAGSDNITLENYVFRRMTYTQSVCNGGICKSVVSSQTTSPVKTLQTGEAALFDMIDPQGRVMVLSNSQRTKVTAMIIDTVTGDVTQIIMANTEGDFY